MMMERKQSISNRATTPPSLPVVRHFSLKVADNDPFLPPIAGETSCDPRRIFGTFGGSESSTGTGEGRNGLVAGG